ncbi:universal stress protein [Yinghuangia sp. ASG 101]|uniref:universal stress protein n=1 Tax=Yinghuangia sp. ASG 101 TaxID=2896848 RepID=UPI001E598E49|nr:universal stress protein [Yinghuangia sp. ASG 101]UGQ12687.1 universal stress protein [Yinghuangia sp. ASG 101]
MTEDNDRTSAHVIVAVDGSPAADNAVDWAADEAALRGTRLEVLHAWEWKPYEGHEWYGEQLLGVSDDILEAAVTRARARRPELAITATVDHGVAEEVVGRAGDRAGLLVMGSRGRGGFTGMLLGSVSRSVAAEGRCPLLVVRAGLDGTAEPRFDGESPRVDTRVVVVGVADESCLPAVEAAHAEAVARGQRLRAVHAWSFPDMPAYGLAGAGPTAEAVRMCRENGEAVLTRTLERVRARHGDASDSVDVVEDVVNGGRARVMVEASRDASLVVVATHKRPGRIGRHLGPVTHALLHHAHAPVLLVPIP